MKKEHLSDIHLQMCLTFGVYIRRGSLFIIRIKLAEYAKWMCKYYIIFTLKYSLKDKYDYSINNSGILYFISVASLQTNLLGHSKSSVFTLYSLLISMI